MREVIVVCRSKHKSRKHVETVLDRYFWRIGDQTWRGQASNACLDRMARELRKKASRSTAIAVHEIRSSTESRVPIIRIGSKTAFSEEGLVAVSSHPAQFVSSRSSHPNRANAAAVVAIAALFHDLGKATRLFQDKLRKALKNPRKPEADAVRHELFSAFAWDRLTSQCRGKDDLLIECLQNCTPNMIDEAARSAIRVVSDRYHEQSTGKNAARLRLEFEDFPASLRHHIGMLILTHHRLPGAEGGMKIQADRHVSTLSKIDRKNLEKSLSIAPGAPYWHEGWFLAKLKGNAGRLTKDAPVSSLDIALRASLMLGDHYGSAKKKATDQPSLHLANTEIGETCRPADSLSAHVRKVTAYAGAAFDTLHTFRDRFPALSREETPIEIIDPRPSENRFEWQRLAASAARELCEANEGGFFACLMAGTGSGKTRGAPTILAAAAFADTKPHRRYLRMNLAVGLRTLATQTGTEYVRDLGFAPETVATIVGTPPLEFKEEILDDSNGSESSIVLPDWLRVQNVAGAVPEAGSDGEKAWLRSLSLDNDRDLPAFCQGIAEISKNKRADFERLLRPPVVAATIDHLMLTASPANSRYLAQAIRTMTSDMIIDEIDQFDPEDISAIGRLVYQAGAAGRRVIAMSATLPRDVASMLYRSYVDGWKEFAHFEGMSERVNALCTADAAGSCMTNTGDEAFESLYDACRTQIVSSLRIAPALRQARIGKSYSTWIEMIEQIDSVCSELHDTNHVELDGFRASFGFVRLTRIAHTAATFMQLPTGTRSDRLRLKACLHSRFPRLHRSFIEQSLKKALTRKNADLTGLRTFCERNRVFERARLAGVRDIELVIVCSPVIETGNDLDFDYSIIDPSSTRSIVQAAGRVRRHRREPPSGPNVHLLYRSPIVMQGGLLKHPGVETSPSSDTGVPPVSLSEYGDRNIAVLLGNSELSTLDARLVLDDEPMPLLDKEADLRKRMTDLSGTVGRYLSHPSARMTLTIGKIRRFRRPTEPEIRYVPKLDHRGGLDWLVDFAPGRKESCLIDAKGHGLRVRDDLLDNLIFERVHEQAIAEWKGEAPEEDEAFEAMEVTAPCRSTEALSLEMTYHPATGFTKGLWDHLFCPFGKPPGNQGL